ncbi:MAG TPA: CRISPR-associated helicase Cas3' [Telmatospirillum sp.]|nr:CRISPR-associated helicase Cas3' [Telmatospirillum sp.]
MYFAHSLGEGSNQDEWQSLQDHLVATGHMAARFAREFGAEQAAQIGGLLHDLGKYSGKFQARLNGASESVDHSTAGAKEVFGLAANGADQFAAQLISYAIAGHHAGLADKDELIGRLEKTIESIDDVWRGDIDIDVGALWPQGFKPSKEHAAFQLAFLGRMLFSCLVDADYKDTERFYTPDVDRDWPDLPTHIDSLIARFDAHMADKRATSAVTDVNALRGAILTHVRGHASDSKGLFTLTVPTGGGKTLASLGFALDHAKVHGLGRIVYAIPFTSIIDQNAAIFRSVLGDDFVLEHHSSIDDEKLKDREQRDKLRLAMEDWAAPVVVTTTVQLFESLFANRSSRCRKLHNLANSVIILDEAQTLPLRLLRPCVAAIDELARHYGATIILCTATQPALDVRDFKHGGLELQGRELAPDPKALAEKLKRVRISNGHVLDDDALVEALRDHAQALVIVNSRRHALHLYQQAKQAGLDGIVHLTTRQYAAHRRQILKQVRDDLAAEKPCRLIATSLIEAGVDVDFPRIWRAEAGLDQIAQAAGRCNREGKRPVEQSVVTVFKAKDNPPPNDIAQLVGDFARMADSYGDLLSPDAMRAYFSEVFWRMGPKQLDDKNVLGEFRLSGGQILSNYRTAAQKFRMIESGLVPVIIAADDKVRAVLNRLNSKDASPGKAARELQSFIVQVPPRDVAALKANGRVAFFRPDLWEEQFAVLMDPSLYQPEIGLIWENADVLENTIF